MTAIKEFQKESKWRKRSLRKKNQKKKGAGAAVAAAMMNPAGLAQSKGENNGEKKKEGNDNENVVENADALKIAEDAV